MASELLSSCRNWLLGKPSTVKPRSPYVFCSSSSFFYCGARPPRLSQLCGGVLPGQAEGIDFGGGGRLGVCASKLCGDDHAAEFGEHVSDRGLGLVAVPGGYIPGRGKITWVVAGG